MSRPGGPADKLGNRYEGVWTVDAILDVVESEYHAIVVEPLGEEADGIEFFLEQVGGDRVYHSVKRRQSDGNWTPRQLTSPSTSGRSILGDLFAKLEAPETRAVFGSGTSASILEELTDRAKSAASADDFDGWLHSSGRLSAVFEDDIVPVCRGDRLAAFDSLRCLDIRIKNEPTLRRDVDRRIRAMFRTADHDAPDAAAFRGVVGDFVLDHLGQSIQADDVLTELAAHGFVLNPWAGAERNKLRELNDAYVRDVRQYLINGIDIERPESARVVDALLEEGKWVMLEGGAGAGKSCVVPQVVDRLTGANVPHLVLRMDRVRGDSPSARSLGGDLGLPDSPVLVLGETSGAQASVLVIEQLDALSVASGRNQALWTVFKDLLDDAVARYPDMRVLFVSRAFDLEHDPQLRGLANDRDRVRRISLSALPVDVVREAVATAGRDPSVLGAAQVEILSTPLHLYLFLETEPAATSDFTNAGALFDAYWEEKQRHVDGEAGAGAFAAAVGATSELLSERRELEVPAHLLDSHASALRELASESVVASVDGKYRFFHESFFDYAFARTFSSSRLDLVDWLEADEQPLFRRSQVRQVLSFLRQRDWPTYLDTLDKLLASTRVRFHIKSVTLQCLRGVDSPTGAEWEIVERNAEELADHDWTVVSNSPRWFDVLHDLDLLRSWLASDDDDAVGRAMWLLSMPDLFSERSAEVAGLLQAYQGQGGDWPDRLRHAMARGEVYHSQEMRQLFLALIEDGTLDEARPGVAVNDDWWSLLYRMSTAAPSFTAEVLGALVRPTGRAGPARRAAMIPSTACGTANPVAALSGKLRREPPLSSLVSCSPGSCDSSVPLRATD